MVHGQEDAGTLERFGVRDVAQKEARQAEYFRRFTEEPELRERFQLLLEAEIARVRGTGR